MPKNVLVVLTRDQVDYGKKLESLRLPKLKVIVPKDPYAAEKDVMRANILFANPLIANKYINKAKDVVWVQSTFAGIDAMNDPSLRKDYILTNARDIYGEAIAEYVFSYILLFEKEIIENLAYQKKSTWRQRDARVLRDKTICILGVGSIGKSIAKIAKAFNMHTLGYRTKNEPVNFFDEIFTRENLKKCLPQANYVISALPSTKDTRGIINKATINLMKKNAVFMNVGRSNAVNEKDLIRALQQKKIAKVVLDVFNEEPLPKASPLWAMSNVYITPHMASYVITDKMFTIFAENYKRFLRGKELLYEIDFKKGY